MTTRAAVIADSPLKRHFYRSLLTSFGWQVDVHDVLQLADNIFTQKHIALWLVDANESDDLPDELFDLPVVLFCDEEVPSPDSVEALRLTRRLKDRFHQMGLNTQNSDHHQAVTIALPELVKAKSADDIELVVAVAASAGGPRAVADFFAALPAGLPVALLYGQHIDAPCWQSVPSAAKGSQLESVLIEQQTMLKAAQVHVVPVEGMLEFNQRVVSTQAQAWSGPYSPNFNQYFELVAHAFGEQVIGIVFSGMDNDGVDGAKQIQQVGGKVWAQCSASAEQPSMPDSVADAGVVDFRGTPAELASHLVQTIIARRGRS